MSYYTVPLDMMLRSSELNQPQLIPTFEHQIQIGKASLILTGSGLTFHEINNLFLTASDVVLQNFELAGEATCCTLTDNHTYTYWDKASVDKP